MEEVEEVSITQLSETERVQLATVLICVNSSWIPEVRTRVMKALKTPAGTTLPKLEEAQNLRATIVAGLSARAKRCALQEVLAHSLADGKYDARMRVALRQLAREFNEEWSFVASAEKILALQLLDNMEAKQNIGKKSSNSVGRWLKVGAGAMVGGAALVVTGGLAAPLLIPAAGQLFVAASAAVAAMGAPAIAAAVGSAGATLIASLSVGLIVGMFGAAGAGLSGYRMLRRTGGVTEFSFLPLKKGETCFEVRAPYSSGPVESTVPEGWLCTPDKMDITVNNVQAQMTNMKGAVICMENRTRFTLKFGTGEFFDGTDFMSLPPSDRNGWLYRPPQTIPPQNVAVFAVGLKSSWLGLASALTGYFVYKGKGFGIIHCFSVPLGIGRGISPQCHTTALRNTNYDSPQDVQVLRHHISFVTSAGGHSMLGIENSNEKIRVHFRGTSQQYVCVEPWKKKETLGVVVPIIYTPTAMKDILDDIGSKYRRLALSIVNTTPHPMQFKFAHFTSGKWSNDYHPPDLIGANLTGCMAGEGKYIPQPQGVCGLVLYVVPLLEIELLCCFSNPLVGTYKAYATVMKKGSFNPDHFHKYYDNIQEKAGISKYYPDWDSSSGLRVTTSVGAYESSTKGATNTTTTSATQYSIPADEANENNQQQQQQQQEEEATTPKGWQVVYGPSGETQVFTLSEAIDQDTAMKDMLEEQAKNNEKEVSSLHLVMGVSGILTAFDARLERDELQKAYWSPVLSSWPLSTLYADMYCVQWETQIQLDLGNWMIGEDSLADILQAAATKRGAQVAIQKGLEEGVKSQAGTLAFAALLAVQSAVMLPRWAAKATAAIDNSFSVAQQRANQVGELIADCLMQHLQGHRPVTLIAFSTGCTAVFSALTRLAHKKAMGIIENVVFLGAPISVDAREWREAISVVAGRMINLYSTRDSVLQFLFNTIAIQFSYVAGLRKVTAVPGLENIDVSDKVTTHADWMFKAKELLAVIPQQPDERTMGTELTTPGWRLPLLAFNCALYQMDGLLSSWRNIAVGIKNKTKQDLHLVGSAFAGGRWEFTPPKFIPASGCGICGCCNSGPQTAVTGMVIFESCDVSICCLFHNPLMGPYKTIVDVGPPGKFSKDNFRKLSALLTPKDSECTWSNGTSWYTIKHRRGPHQRFHLTQVDDDPQPEVVSPNKVGVTDSTTSDEHHHHQQPADRQQQEVNQSDQPAAGSTTTTTCKGSTNSIVGMSPLSLCMKRPNIPSRPLITCVCMDEVDAYMGVYTASQAHYKDILSFMVLSNKTDWPLTLQHDRCQMIDGVWAGSFPNKIGAHMCLIAPICTKASAGILPDLTTAILVGEVDVLAEDPDTLEGIVDMEPTSSDTEPDSSPDSKTVCKLSVVFGAFITMFKTRKCAVAIVETLPNNNTVKSQMKELSTESSGIALHNTVPLPTTNKTDNILQPEGTNGTASTTGDAASVKGEDNTSDNTNQTDEADNNNNSKQTEEDTSPPAVVGLTSDMEEEATSTLPKVESRSEFEPKTELQNSQTGASKVDVEVAEGAPMLCCTYRNMHMVQWCAIKPALHCNPF